MINHVSSSESHLGPRVNESEVGDNGSRIYSAIESGIGAHMAGKLKL